MTKHVAALIVAAGRGTRLARTSEDLPKQYRDLGGKPILARTLEAFLTHRGIAKAMVVIHPDDLRLYETVITSLPAAIHRHLEPPVFGGETRQASVANGLKALQRTAPDFVLIHDAARPMVSAEVIANAISTLKTGAPACLAAVPVFDTLKRIAPENPGHLQTVDRTNLWAAQTPQGFAFPQILDAHEAAKTAGRLDFTDDTGLAEWAGHAVTLTLGAPDNFKITTADDLDRAEMILARETQIMTAPLPTTLQRPTLASLPDVRMGQGYDVHAFEDGDAVILGGVPVAHSKKLKGHSDADVVLHALTDAIFGALADGDIGSHFPPSDPQWKGAASDQFLIYALQRLSARGGRLAHADVTIVCEAPKIGPVRDTLRASIAKICDLPIGRVSVKATTSERLGFTGRKEGIACLACATIRLPFDDE
ncbi:bifunctional 2-C-methyl-D-erythritol 4-phosphate cytidylyltransferase/2-C-methyl-D-erythritol 2,4-cyclodiphosphate synthase [Roseibium sp. CAU 1637]|uniref:Bifunctional enzyme IspD/IspF n=1 Tax=Roseibium limicola TaxID=2816037 RepID=A0A939J845_9HYPH|nr:bifunctional 2-C-methyl-D-erythritol 4-phosphate cytidylyltransferase/2-C-methyl-D-erythritol 2,4-cyclodiphosphate synthase [Roseibium limicola]MBO0344484.1 bifunctional 2-C-methyl-D-erythritol 4-phosphate cytidylyltransferase/2-C-methyl-D-erythritol 2,4-cyclodiphosphate synthase [Roseibium limicola]